MGEQLDLFGDMAMEWELSEHDVLKHMHRMHQQIQNKTGALKRIAQARIDDIVAKKIAEENIVLRRKVQEHQQKINEQNDGSRLALLQTGPYLSYENKSRNDLPRSRSSTFRS